MTIRSKQGPLVGKSTVLPFPISVVCWFDLLGYGDMIAAANFNPLHTKATEAMVRLRAFHELVASHSARHFPTLVMNDGAVAYRDLSFRTSPPTLDFLSRAWHLYSDIQRLERAHGLPGARAVLAAGFRMRGRRAGRDAVSSHFKSVMKRYQDRQIDANQAIREAARIRQSFDVVPQLQANFAFTKAYVAENSGTKGGLGGAKFFVDLALFDKPIPLWVKTGDTVAWSNERLRMKASFAPLTEISLSGHELNASDSPGIRDGLEVAQDLTQDPNVLRKLRAARKPT